VIDKAGVKYSYQRDLKALMKIVHTCLEVIWLTWVWREESEVEVTRVAIFLR
jgi:hypothetical protein